MLTSNDQLAREVLIATHDWFSEDRRRWTQGKIERQLDGGLVARCMLGEMSHRLGLSTAVVPASAVWTVISDGMVVVSSTPAQVYGSLLHWLCRRGNSFSIAHFNDTHTYEEMLSFLEERIAELDASLVEQALVEQAPVERAPMEQTDAKALAMSPG